MANEAKERLVEFLDREAFRPVLDKDPEDYSGSEREKLEEVQDATRRERERFEERASASGIIDEFKGDMSSEPAEEVSRKLRDLDLPALPDLEDRFREEVERTGMDY